MKRLLIAATFLITIAAVGAGLLYSWGHQRFTGPGPLDERKIVLIERGSGLEAIARQLTQEGVIRSPLLFRVGARVTGQARRLKAGEFEFPAEVSPERALQIIVSGRTVARTLTIPEGLTSREVVARIREAPALTGEIGQVPDEGTLLPETYHYQRGDSRADLLQRMQASMDGALAELWPRRAEELPYDTKQAAVTLASIVEKETAVPDERALVAGVFVNRLERGMRLQSDPTVRYALTEGEEDLGRPLTRADWKVEHPYNTYRITGLPPGPIANPGRAALEAALNPADTEYLYFVADGSGGHAFAKTLREHNRNVAEWRKVRDGDK
ncbi:MAG: endolytic transglycosylase MltG [Rhodovibrio sp.]|nr:endolytic transglycosylase MltG [Rhodovibrio sp.]